MYNYLQSVKNEVFEKKQIEDFLKDQKQSEYLFKSILNVDVSDLTKKE